MGDARFRRLTRADLEAVRQEIVGEREGASGGLAYSLDDDLHQIRLCASLEMSLEDWAKARDLPVAYARALRRYLDQD
jgi:hypothetical protein